MAVVPLAAAAAQLEPDPERTPAVRIDDLGGGDRAQVTRAPLGAFTFTQTR
jgi:hypothetical protein